MLVAASMSIAAGGYIINDYFDLNIDRVNKPDKLVIGNFIKRRWAILWHLGFSFTGIFLSIALSIRIGNSLLAVFNIITVVILWFYSTTFKKQLLVGNILISLLTGFFCLLFLAGCGDSTDDESETLSKKNIDLDPNYWYAHLQLFYVYRQKRYYAAAVEELAKVQESRGETDAAKFIRESFAGGDWPGFLKKITADRTRLKL